MLNASDAEQYPTRFHRRWGRVYFAWDPQKRALKIGFTGKDPGSRVAQLGYSLPWLQPMLLGSFEAQQFEEFKLHRRFAKLRHGTEVEWFHPSAELLAVIEERCGRWPGLVPTVR